ncbi:peptide-n(4)-(n-acetyl-beta-glucosaminyl) asparagine amidase [Plakobranchus ocellatus]|uniref:Peptide-N(4)-(N-acetyl-beta-glucosaminyl)asparagine amidase n=1 Tax=Plakobranchus ocellatus TaxID=259542 RepID=A0AAV4AF59_9GAST|nr:peptide-n(4)-(n-acetyl-beta-glucosaminyl) asparagine amidase [Plakobranchus ocellatus]
MEPTDDIVSTLVKENSKEDFLSASGILIKFADNILTNPHEPKYRKIRIGNPAVQSKLLNFVGAMECLFIMGFEEAEDGEHLTLSDDKSLQPLRNVRDGLMREQTKIQTPQQHQEIPQGARQRLLPNLSPARSFQMPSETNFAARIGDGMRRVLRYEDPNVQEKARQAIPVDKLLSEAESSFKAAQAKGESTSDQRDFLLLGLLKWFKFTFFKWVDTLPCSQCGGATQHNGSLQPTTEDLRWGAGRVEAHMCKVCHINTRFPRYTNAEKLLETRRGRCGEWADCFTLCCRALGFEARFVMDWTDHVWTEVYSNSKSRWLHCDPCENICDKPLLYESGWGKKLTYAIAVSKDEVQDVSWRYSANHREMLSRRTLCREPWLRRTIHSLWRKQIATLPQERQKELWTRLLCELSDFICVKSSDENLPGRSTGSLAWRQARGELGHGTAAQVSADVCASNNAGFVFTPTERERESEIMHVVYNCSTDRYLRKSSADEILSGWEKCVFGCKHVFRKEELDWKMAYLARTEGSSEAEITWKFDLNGTDLRIGKMELKAQTTVFENGKVSWKICGEDACFTPAAASLQDFMTFDLKGSKMLTVTAVLQHGKGGNAWQHTQLFRQALSETDSYPFYIKLMLN